MRAARKAGDGALVHPGYGFLSESAEFAAACAAAGLVFVGPAPEVLRLFGDKVAARAAAEKAGIPVIPATTGAASPERIAELLAAHPKGVMVKAAAGGGGRGMRVVRAAAEVGEAYERCRAEAIAGFGDDTVYAEALVSEARHIEVQIIADGERAIAVGDRDCSVQRRQQKLIEVAPAPNLAAGLRKRLHEQAVRLAESVRCRGVVTVEFLVSAAESWFLEVNPRLQVEHTITEEVTGLDLVAVQLELARGRTLAELDLTTVEPRGYAVQVRVNAEIVTAGGEVLPSTGTLTQFAAPTGAGVRVDTAASIGMRQDARFDSLLAKIIAREYLLSGGGAAGGGCLGGDGDRRCRDESRGTTRGAGRTGRRRSGVDLVVRGPGGRIRRQGSGLRSDIPRRRGFGCGGGGPGAGNR